MIGVERKFEWAEQLAFARYSGDHNPIHVDAIAARRLLFGEPVVHGMHLLLWVLDIVAPIMQGMNSKPDWSVRVRFRKPVFIGESVRLVIFPAEGNELKCLVRCDEAVLVSARIAPAEASTGLSMLAEDPCVDTNSQRGGPDVLGINDLEGQCGHLTMPVESRDGLASFFPNLSALFGVNRVGELALLSTLVGMRVPGMHSLFAALTLRLVGRSTEFIERSPVLTYRVMSVSTQFRLVRVQATAEGTCADVEAFCYPTPSISSSVAVSNALPEGSYAGRTVLVVGGSRGLGALAARLAAAAGARVVATFARGVDEAAALARIPGITVTRLDVAALTYEELDACFTMPVDTLIYCATPRIFFRRTKPLHADRLAAFTACYVSGFAQVFQRFASQATTGAQCLHPSSVAVTQNDPDNIEYRLAKQAGEGLCDALAALYPRISVHRPRLPRLDTDQTAQIGAPPPEDTLEYMARLLSHMCTFENSHSHERLALRGTRH